MKIKSKFAKGDEKPGPPDSKNKDFSKSWSSFGSFSDSDASLSDESLNDKEDHNNNNNNKDRKLMAKLSASFSNLNLAMPLKGLKKPKRRGGSSTAANTETEAETETKADKDQDKDSSEHKNNIGDNQEEHTDSANEEYDDFPEELLGNGKGRAALHSAPTGRGGVNMSGLRAPSLRDVNSSEENDAPKSLARPSMLAAPSRQDIIDPRNSRDTDDDPQPPPTRPTLLAPPSMRNVIDNDESFSEASEPIPLPRPSMLSPPSMRDVTKEQVVGDDTANVDDNDPSCSYKSPDSKSKPKVTMKPNSPAFSPIKESNFDEDGDDDIYDSDYMASPKRPVEVQRELSPKKGELPPPNEPLEEEPKESEPQPVDEQEKETAKDPLPRREKSEPTIASLDVSCEETETEMPLKGEPDRKEHSKRHHRRRRSDGEILAKKSEGDSSRRKRSSSRSRVEPRPRRRGSEQEDSSSRHSNASRERPEPKDHRESRSRRRGDRDSKRSSRSKSRSKSKSRKRNDGRRRRPDIPLVTEQSFKISGSEILDGKIIKDPPTAHMAPSFKVRPLEEASPVQFSPALEKT